MLKGFEVLESGFVLVAEQDDATRELLVASLGHIFDVRATASGREAVAMAVAEQPALVVVDPRLDDFSGYEVCVELRERYEQEIPILFVSADRTEPHDRAAGRLIGGDDYLAMPFDEGELLARVRRLLVRRTAATNSVGATRFAQLTRREREVLLLLAEGHSAGEIAQTLVISPKTAATHIQRILEKLGVHSRAEAVAVAYRDGSPVTPSKRPALDREGEAKLFPLPQRSGMTSRR